MSLSIHRAFGLGVLLALTALFTWASFGELDIVVNAQGKLVPASFVRITQPADAGVIKQVLVRDGERVKAGQPLLELDATVELNDRQALTHDVERLSAALARIQAEGGAGTNSVAPVAADFAARRAAFAATLLEAQRASDRAEAELTAGQAELARMLDLEKFAAGQAARNKDLVSSGFISQSAFDEMARDAVDARNRVVSQQKTVSALKSASEQARAALARVQADYSKSLAIERLEVEGQLSRAKAELAKSTHKEELAVLRAPVDGVVTGLDSRAAGQVVQPGAVLLSVVPDSEKLVAEVWVRNEDAGFVSPGMPVKVKLATFPFQKYGWLDGEVTWIGADSETPEAMRNAAGEILFYRARVSLERQALVKDGRTFEARPGMQVTADVQLGKRTLLEYLVSPLKKTVLEAARER